MYVNANINSGAISFFYVALQTRIQNPAKHLKLSLLLKKFPAESR